MARPKSPQPPAPSDSASLTPIRGVQISLVTPADSGASHARASSNAPPSPSSGIEVLGQHFSDEAACREHFMALLAQKLQDPAFRALPGFPDASDDQILRISDPPWYTACPNPFLADFVAHTSKPRSGPDRYQREPLAIDTSVGKTDALYKAHGYHTKVPHLAIVPSILHYTDPGDLVLDGFCGSGLMGVAAQWCANAPQDFRLQLEATRSKQGLPPIKWGARRAVLNDLSPAATFIAQGFNLPFKVDAFDKAARQLLQDAEKELGWMYATRHSDGSPGRINYVVWSEVFACPACSGDIVFVKEALDPETKRVKDVILCPGCGCELQKKRGARSAEGEDEDTGALSRAFVTTLDPATGRPWTHVRFDPVFINYSIRGKSFEKPLDAEDRAVLDRIEAMPLPKEVPTGAFPLKKMYHGSRLGPKGFTHLHHFFLPRAAQSLAFLWRSANAHPSHRIRSMLLWFVEQAIWGLSILNRYQPIQQGRPGGSQVNRALTGVYYIPSQISECSPWYNLENRSERLVGHAFVRSYSRSGQSMISTGSASGLGLPDGSVDYIFTDPPFGENIYYADLNFLVESWHGLKTRASEEAIIDRAKDKDVYAYERLMLGVFREYHRVLKAGRWMTVVFSNSHNAVWNALQVALGEAGFVVADVRSLDKQQGSYRQVTSTAVKEDLVVTCYKPTEALEQRVKRSPLDTSLGNGDPELAWAFLEEHLSKLSIGLEGANGLEVQAERTPDALYDRFVAFCLQRRLAVPLSKEELLQGVSLRFSLRDGMAFLATQVDAYDAQRARVGRIGQLPLLVTNEASAVQWLRIMLTRGPLQFEELQPDFMKQTQHWAKSEEVIDLRVLLEQNFIKDGVGRWKVADPGLALDMEKRRTAQLLREFEVYVQDKRRRLDVVRRDALHAGFHDAYLKHQWSRILKVAERLNPKLLDDDIELYMYVENARTQEEGVHMPALKE